VPVKKAAEFPKGGKAMGKLSSIMTIVFSKNYLLATDKKAYIMGGEKTLLQAEGLLNQINSPLEGMRYELTAVSKKGKK
jgi:hypothetical protein